MVTLDVHQHLLPEALVAELARRREPPALVLGRDAWTFRVAGEPDSLLAFEATDVELRVAELRASGIDRAFVALSTALGIETLPAEEAAPLLEAHNDIVDTLPSQFGAWGAVGLESPDPDDVDTLIARGHVGIALPAAALASPAAFERVSPLLARLEFHGAPLFVHPGPVPRPSDGPADTSVPPWWPALTDYVAQMQAAWFTFLHAGRRAHPHLRVLFAMLAGGAPLHLERFAARSGTAAPAPDPLTFYDTSSYGPQMLGAMAIAVGADQLVYGSDRPVVDAYAPSQETQFGEALMSANPHRLLTPNLEGVPR